MSFNKKILKGVGWSGIQLGINRLLGVLVKLILARLLFPEDFGLIGMAAVFIAIVRVVQDIGIGQALIQQKEEISETEYNTGFWSAVLWSLFLYCILFIASPWIAEFYEQPQITEILRIISLNILASPLYLIQHVKLTRELKFKQIALINNIASIAGALMAVTAAFSGFGVWSLVIQTVAPPILMIPLYFITGRWWPSFNFDKTFFHHVFKFGAFVTAGQIFGRIAAQADYLLVGKMLGAYELGIYSFAFLITSTIRNQLNYVISRVMLPVYGKIQNDEALRKKYYLKTLEINVFLLYPALALLIVFAGPFIEVVFPKWTESIILIQILAAGTILSTLYNGFTAFIQGIGKPKVEMSMQIGRTVLYVLLILVGYYWAGLEGVAWAFAVTSFVVAFTVFALLTSRYSFHWGEIGRVLWRPALGFVIVLLSGFSLQALNTSIFLQIVVVVAALIAYNLNSAKSYYSLVKKA